MLLFQLLLSCWSSTINLLTGLLSKPLFALSSPDIIPLYLISICTIYIQVTFLSMKTTLLIPSYKSILCQTSDGSDFFFVMCARGIGYRKCVFVALPNVYQGYSERRLGLTEVLLKVRQFFSAPPSSVPRVGVVSLQARHAAKRREVARRMERRLSTSSTCIKVSDREWGFQLSGCHPTLITPWAKNRHGQLHLREE